MPYTRKIARARLDSVPTQGETRHTKYHNDDDDDDNDYDYDNYDIKHGCTCIRTKREIHARVRHARIYMCKPRERKGKEREKKKAAEPLSKTPTSYGKNGHGAIMFLLGFISKRVINYTSKYNDDDEGYDDIIYYWIYIHTYSICIYMIHQKLYSLRHCRITRTSPLSFRLKSMTKCV